MERASKPWVVMGTIRSFNRKTAKGRPVIRDILEKGKVLYEAHNG
jgi:hypothetical protein